MRYKKVLISGEFITRLFTSGNIIHAECIEGIPDGSRFVYSIPSPYWGVYVVIEHESFPLLKDGDEIPDHDKPLMKKL